MAPHSCGHRNCPHFESQQWIERQTQRLVPGRYFLITFTLPSELRPLAWQHQRLLYAKLMECAWQTLRTFSQNHKQLQGSPGAVAVLHTHSRRLDFHPHVRVAMPAGALDAGTPTPRANPSAPLRPCLAVRQTGCEAQGDGFYSRSPNLRRVKNSVESRFRSHDGAQRNRGRFSAPDFIAFHPGYAR